MNNKYIAFLLLFAVLQNGCKPNRDDDFGLNGTPVAPEFSAVPLADDPNRVVITDLSSGNFQRIWDLSGASPKTSTKAIDTVFYQKAGTYNINLFVTKLDGSGTAQATKQVVITQDGALACSPKFEMLTGCGNVGKCWTLAHDAAAVKVGPTYDDYSWFTSPVNGLQDAQYDDGFCFTFENLKFQYKNNGGTVNPFNGYQVEPFDAPIVEFTFLEGTGTSGRDQIVIPNTHFMGVRDCDNVMDVVKLTASELVIRAKLCEPNGTPKSEGWFELKFVPQ